MKVFPPGKLVDLKGKPWIDSEGNLHSGNFQIIPKDWYVASGGSAPAFDPATVGLVYEVDDFSSMFQDAAQIVPVTAVGQPVRVIRDRSSANLHLVAPSDAARPLLAQDGSGRYYLDFPDATPSMITASTITTPTPALIAGLVSFGAGTNAGVSMVLRLNSSPTTAYFSLAVRSSIMAARAKVRIYVKGVPAVIINGATNDIVADDVRVHHVDHISLSMRRGIDGTDLYSAATAWDAQTLDNAAFQLFGVLDSPFRFYGGCVVVGPNATTRKAEVIQWLDGKK